MKKPARKKSHSTNKTKIAIAATILTIPLFSLPGTGFAEVDYFLKLQSKDKFSIVGSSDGHTVYKNTEGKFFYLDPKGDMKFIAFEPYLKIGSELKKSPATSNAAANLHIKMTDVLISSYSIVGLDDGRTIYKNAKGEFFYLDPANGDMKFIANGWIPLKGRGIDIKGQSNVSILGVDAKRNVVHENSRGEKFYLDAITGDMIFVNGSGLTPFHAASPESSGAPGVSRKPDTKTPAGAPSAAPKKTSTHSSVKILGLDAKGNTVNENSRGEKFYLDALTGDMIFVDGRGLTAFHAAPRPAGNSGDKTPHNKYADDFTQLKQVEKPVDTQKSGISDQAANLPNGKVKAQVTALQTALAWLPTTASSTVSPLNGEDKTPPGLMGEPIDGVDVKLGKNPGGSIAVAKTGKDGAFHFSNLPEGKYRLTLPGMPSQSVDVGADGIVGGNVMRGSDGTISIFDRWGNSVAAPKAGDKKPGIDGQKNDNPPVGGFGTGMGTGPDMSSGMGGAVMSPPGAVMGGAGGPAPGMSPMGPGAGGPMGAAGPMRP